MEQRIVKVVIILLLVAFTAVITPLWAKLPFVTRLVFFLVLVAMTVFIASRKEDKA